MYCRRTGRFRGLGSGRNRAFPSTRYVQRPSLPVWGSAHVLGTSPLGPVVRQSASRRSLRQPGQHVAGRFEDGHAPHRVRGPPAFRREFTVTLNKRQSPRRSFIWSPRFSEAGVRVVQTPYEVRNANTDAERPVRAIEEESLDHPIPPRERHVSTGCRGRAAGRARSSSRLSSAISTGARCSRSTDGLNGREYSWASDPLRSSWGESRKHPSRPRTRL
jgi:hypothetical protein